MRYLAPFIVRDLQKKMVFMGGPRQCGKTTLAKYILHGLRAQKKSGVYFNWDDDRHREAILKRRWSDTDRLIVFDEIHKFPRWKNWLKGIYDTQHDLHQILVTGSARLDVYRRDGDSLLGRYHYWRLHPFSLSELPPKMSPKEAFQRLMTVGGFPEPFLDGSETAAKRWRRDRFDRILRDDIRDLEPLRNIQTLSLFVDKLRRQVGSSVVLSNIAQDLQVAPKTLKHWLDVLEKMYLVFVVPPYTKNVSRAILKPPKVYFFDTGDVLGDAGARYENLVATHLLKRLHFLEDNLGERCELRYVRDKEGHEVDFAVIRDGKLSELIEAKLSNTEISRSLKYHAARLKPAICKQVVGTLRRGYDAGGIRVLSAIEEFAVRASPVSIRKIPWRKSIP